MNDKAQVITMMKEEVNRWDELLSGMSEAQATDPQLPDHWSVKDVIAHLWAWQLRSVARLEAAAEGHEPLFPDWPPSLDPEIEEQPHQLNDWLYTTYRDKPWAQVYQDWRDGFFHLIELADAMPEQDLLAVGKYGWLEDYSLAFILQASCEHHAEHWEWLLPIITASGGGA